MPGGQGFKEAVAESKVGVLDAALPLKNAAHANPGGIPKHVHRIGDTPFEGHVGIGIEENVPHSHNA
jgi:hypothetical protein